MIVARTSQLRSYRRIGFACLSLQLDLVFHVWAETLRGPWACLRTRQWKLSERGPGTLSSRWQHRQAHLVAIFRPALLGLGFYIDDQSQLNSEHKARMKRFCKPSTNYLTYFRLWERLWGSRDDRLQAGRCTLEDTH
eukprot:5162617-Pyramimonas_sp.AAC.1